MGRTETTACRPGPLLPLPQPVPNVGHCPVPCSPALSPLHLPVGSGGPHSTRNMAPLSCPAAYSTLAGFWNVPELSGCDFFLRWSPELLEAHSFPSFAGGTPQVPISGLLGQASSLAAACCPHGVKVQAGSQVVFFTCGTFQVGTSSSGPQGDTCSQEGSLDLE
uniref:Uncharacterized protein n=1 Tax=Pan paniscus TaxID=9597 RepID=A0A2R9BHR5_PANPA